MGQMRAVKLPIIDTYSQPTNMKALFVKILYKYLLEFNHFHKEYIVILKI